MNIWYSFGKRGELAIKKKAFNLEKESINLSWIYPKPFFYLKRKKKTKFPQHLFLFLFFFWGGVNNCGRCIDSFIQLKTNWPLSLNQQPIRLCAIKSLIPISIGRNSQCQRVFWAWHTERVIAGGQSCIYYRPIRGRLTNDSVSSHQIGATLMVSQ